MKQKMKLSTFVAKLISRWCTLDETIPIAEGHERVFELMVLMMLMMMMLMKIWYGWGKKMILCFVDWRITLQQFPSKQE